METIYVTLSDGSRRPVLGVASGSDFAVLAVGGATLPAALGQATMAASLAVVIASDQSAIATKPQARVARAVHLASAQLPGAGAYTSQTAYSIPDGVKEVKFYVTYTRGGAAGQPKFKIMDGNGTEEGPVVVVDPAVTPSEPLSRQTIRGGEFLGPVPADGSAITFVVPVKVEGGNTTVRLLAAEHGNTGAPGTLAIALTASY